ncbi:hypothetical protein EDC01DRAFT_777190 [Geopyxis carbonaria]|nr:hypothetical protein EDC01DRAFT_777190 [Geopyxis carbonaria]
MSSDDTYAAFLAKANKDYSAADEEEQSLTAKDVSDPNPPAAIKALGSDRCYTSDSDEPFVAISLPYGGTALPDNRELSKLLEISTVDSQDVLDWDPRGKYKDVTDAVAKAGNGAVNVYYLQSGTSIKYWVLSVDQKAGKLVGVVVMAYES